MRYDYDVKELLKNPKVSYADRWKVTLKLTYRIELFKVWKVNQSQVEVEKILEKDKLGRTIVGPNFCNSLCTSFKSSGYPSPKNKEEILEIINDENPLITSGKFERNPNGKGIQMTPDFERELFALYPEVSVESGLEKAGIDLLDVGYNRIHKIKHIFEERAMKMYGDADKKESSSDLAVDDENYDYTKLYCSDKTYASNPYVKSVNNGTAIMQEAFYNEVYVMRDLSLEEIFKIYGLDISLIGTQNRMIIMSKMYNWNPTSERIDIASELLNTIQRKRLKAMNTLVHDGFVEIGKAYKRMPAATKRLMCRQFETFPRDAMGTYTIGNILKLVGIPKSTYYTIVNSESYGASTERKATQDEADIEIIRQVLAYKGFEKGIRQVHMLMPKVMGEQFSIYRIRRLMNKYGIRTTIRRPSKNRKAMKELIARNKKANLLMRKFKLHRPNEVRLTDVTYLDYGDGLRAYGSASVDPVTGRLICFIISENNDLQLALDTLEAMDAYPAKRGAILHSDQGILYMTDDFQAAVVERELTQSMSRRGNCWDNAVQESFFGHFKDECHYENCKTFEELQKCIAEYSDYYNNERGMWDKGKMTPTEYEKYLTEMDGEAFAKYLASEEKKYLEMKEKAAQKAVQNAKEYKAFIEEAMEELK